MFQTAKSSALKLIIKKVCLKRFYKSADGSIILVSENPNYLTI